MKIGLLLCGNVRENLQPRHGDYPSMFFRWFESLAPDWKLYDVREGEMPDEPRDCDVWLYSGSRQGVYDELPWLPPLQDWARRLFAEGVPQVGICFGHQLLAQALGGKAGKNGRGWGVGAGVWQLVGNAPVWVDPVLQELRLCCIHQDQVQVLPAGATLLASSDFCPLAAYYIDSRVLCFQGHPEMTADYIRALMQLRAADISGPAREEAHRSLDGISPDAPIVARWIENFVNQNQV